MNKVIIKDDAYRTILRKLRKKIYSIQTNNIGSSKNIVGVIRILNDALGDNEFEIEEKFDRGEEGEMVENGNNEWEYRVVENGYYSIRDVCTHKGLVGEIVEPIGETYSELLNNLDLIVGALKKPVLEERDGKLIEISK